MRPASLVRAAAACSVLFLTCLPIRPVQAVTIFTDDFNRPDSTSLGSNWTELRHDLTIAGNRLGGRRIIADGDGRDALASFVAPGSILDGGFTLQGQVGSFSSLHFLFEGLAFRIQDANNFYGFRFSVTSSTIEFVKYVGGTPTVPAGAFSVPAGFTLLPNTFYDLSVYGSPSGTYTFSLTDGVNTFSKIGFDGSGTPYLNGRAGMLGFVENTGSDTVLADNFFLMVPEPSTPVLVLAGLAVAAARRRPAPTSALRR